MLVQPFPNRHWQKVALDLFSYKQKGYPLVVDYYPNYPEITQLPETTSETLISRHPSSHGIAEEVVSDYAQHSSTLLQHANSSTQRSGPNTPKQMALLK